jgi:hypothetical protein
MMLALLMRGEAKMAAGLACDGNSRACGVPEPIRFPADRGEASYRDDFLTDMVKLYDPCVAYSTLRD